MNPPTNLDRKVRDLAFELEDSQGPKFLIAVCDDAGQRTTLRTDLTRHLSQSGKKMTYVSADSLKHDLIRTLADRARAENVQAISLWGIDDLDSAVVGQLFAQLNVHRDWLAQLNIPIVLWISTELLNELANMAPDFWSRRSAVYYFSERTFDDLLTRLFAQERDKSQKWRPEPALSDAFETILSSEKELAYCLRDKTAFSIARIDDCICKIKGGVFQLIEECHKGRQIEVAFWLWSLSHLDSELQDMLDSLKPEQRSLFESLYTDRNEVLLHLSENLSDLLHNYLRSLEENIKKKKRVSLVSRAKGVATSEIRKMASALILSVEIPLSSEMEEFEEFYSARLEQTRREPQENAFLIKAAEDSESWLSGHTNKCPPFFSKEEAKLLKLLYSNASETMVIAQELGTPLSKATEKVRYLERKVRLYLGLPPRLPSARRVVREDKQAR